MRVTFSCHACGIRDVGVEIADKGRAETTARWMGMVQRVVARAHGMVSPRCSSRRVDLTIPVTAEEAK